MIGRPRIIHDRKGNPMLVDRCQQCSMIGVLRPKRTEIPPTEYNPVAERGDGDLRSYVLCITCFETPIGVRSENQEHKRLPDDEYRRNAPKE